MDVLNYLAKLKKRNNQMDFELALEYAEEKGMAKGIIQSIELLLKQESLSIEFIANAFNVSIDSVLQIKENLNKQKKTLPSAVKRKKRVAKPKPQTSNSPQAD